jgi:2-methylcitrate dehydratase PrpD
VIEEADLEKEFPGKTISIMEIKTKGGKVFTDRTEAAKGDPKNPMVENDFIEKFMALTASAMKEQTKQEMIAMIMSLEKLDDTAKLIRLAD